LLLIIGSDILEARAKKNNNIIKCFFMVLIIIFSTTFVQALNVDEKLNKNNDEIRQIKNFYDYNYSELYNIIKNKYINNKQLLNYLSLIDKKLKNEILFDIDEGFHIINGFYKNNINKIKNTISLVNELESVINSNNDTQQKSNSLNYIINNFNELLQEEEINYDFQAANLSYYWNRYLQVRSGMKVDGPDNEYDTYEEWFSYVQKFLMGVDDNGNFDIKETWVLQPCGILMIVGSILLMIGQNPQVPVGAGLLGYFLWAVGFLLFSQKITRFVNIKIKYDALWTKEIDIILRIKDGNNNWLEGLDVFAYNKEIPDAYTDEFPQNDNWKDKFYYKVRKAKNVIEPGYYALSSTWTDPKHRPQPPFPPGYWNIIIPPGQIINDIKYEGLNFSTYDIYECGLYINDTLIIYPDLRGFPIIHRESASPIHNSDDNDINPVLSINVTDPNNDYMKIQFLTNATMESEDTWLLLNCTYDGVKNGMYQCSTEGIFDDYDKTYHWKVIAIDEEDNESNEIFKFSTKVT